MAMYPKYSRRMRLAPPPVVVPNCCSLLVLDRCAQVSGCGEVHFVYIDGDYVILGMRLNTSEAKRIFLVRW